MTQWFNTKGGGLVSADQVRAIFEIDGKVYASLKDADEHEPDVALAAKSIMDVRMMLMSGSRVI